MGFDSEELGIDWARNSETASSNTGNVSETLLGQVLLLSVAAEKKSAVPNILMSDRSVENEMGELKKSSKAVPGSVGVEAKV